MTKKEKQKVEIERHGKHLLILFPDAKDQDPMSLCRRLRRWEGKARKLALGYCNGTLEYPMGEEFEYLNKATDFILDKVDLLLGNNRETGVPIFVNLDARGYTLKVRDDWSQKWGQWDAKDGKKPPFRGYGDVLGYQAAVCQIHKDWGGYIILAPDLS